MDERVWFVYLLECRTDRIYTGVTPDLEQRIASHLAGKGAAFTRINPPERLHAVKPFNDKREAMRMEAQVKRLSRPLKLALATDWLQQYPIDNLRQKAFPAEVDAV